MTKTEEILLEMWAEVSTQNRLLAEMILPTYCEVKGISDTDARARLNEYFGEKMQDRKELIRTALLRHHSPCHRSDYRDNTECP